VLNACALHVLFRNENFAKLSAGYLFPIVAKKRREYVEAHPEAKVISLGIGDTTHPLPAPISDGMAAYCTGLGTREGYEGYDPKSESVLKAKIAEVCEMRISIRDDLNRETTDQHLVRFLTR
jgi:LL-diaminopimelate aminotransferase